MNAFHRFINGLPDSIKGILLMVSGLLLLLHTVGLIGRGVTIILIVISAGMIAYGTVQSGLYGFIMKLITKKSGPGDSNNQYRQ